MIENLETYIPPLLKKYFVHSEVLLLIPLILILVWALILWPRKRKKNEPSRMGMTVTLFFFRTLMILALMLALATPFFEREVTLNGEPTLKVLVDNSTSMQLFNTKFVDGLVDRLRTRIDVEVINVGTKDASTLGQDIIAHAKTGDSMLVVSDAQITRGVDWSDVLAFAYGNNITISGIDMDPVQNDYFVTILSPTKTTIGTETPVGVVVGSAGEQSPVHVTLAIDGKVILDETSSESLLSTTYTFSEGYHTLEARISPIGDDHFAENNVAYRTIKASPRPKLAIVTQRRSTPLEIVAKQLYSVDVLSSIPNDLSAYHATILNDIPVSMISNEKADVLTDYVIDGNGLFVVGGRQSFDLGGYRSSQIETILPAFVGATGTTGGESSVVVLLDISASTGSVLGGGDKSVDVEKALALQAALDVGEQNQLGIAAFNHQTYVVYPLQYNADKTEIEGKIKRLYDFGGTLIDMGILEGLEMLKGAGGSRNIILISDGVTRFPGKAITAAFLAADQGTKIYTVGIGTQTNEQLMQDIARVTHGTYFAASDVNRLKILFGSAEEKSQIEGPREVKVLDSNHFITQAGDPSAKVGGFNYIVPKSTAQLLVTTNSGESLLAVWRIGLGRVAALGTDDGTAWAGQLYDRQNSKLLVRSMNWLIGSPDRLENRIIDVSEAYKGSPATVSITSKIPPSIPGLDFIKIGERTYEAEFIPDTIGIQNFEDAQYAVNAPFEFAETGMNLALKDAAQATGGLFVAASEVDALVENVKSQSRRTLITKDPFRWPLIAFAIALFLIEILVRRLVSNRLRKARAES